MNKYNITGMSCAACQNRVEKAVSKVAGVDSVSVSLLTNSMQVEGNANEKDIFDAVKKEIIDFIRESPDNGEQAADLLMVAKYFERIGDHATNIAEWVQFALDDKKEKK